MEHEANGENKGMDRSQYSFSNLHYYLLSDAISYMLNVES